jgi:hypothetical protein
MDCHTRHFRAPESKIVFWKYLEKELHVTADAEPPEPSFGATNTWTPESPPVASVGAGGLRPMWAFRSSTVAPAVLRVTCAPGLVVAVLSVLPRLERARTRPVTRAAASSARSRPSARRIFKRLIPCHSVAPLSSPRST